MRLGAGVGTFGLVCHYVCLLLLSLSLSRFLVVCEVDRSLWRFARGGVVQEVAGAYCRIRGWAED